MENANPIRFVRRDVFRATQGELAAIGQVSRSRVSRYESGGEDPPYQFLFRIRAEAIKRGLAFSSDWFFAPPKAAAERADEAA